MRMVIAPLQAADTSNVKAVPELHVHNTDKKKTDMRTTDMKTTDMKTTDMKTTEGKGELCNKHCDNVPKRGGITSQHFPLGTYNQNLNCT